MKTLPLAILATLLFVSAAQGQLRISIDFPGGSAEVLDVDQNARRIQLNPTDHPQRGWACWWYLRVDGIRPGETITVDVGEAPWATPDRAAFSLDNMTWSQTPAGQRKGKRIVYRQKVEAERAWFAWGPPFVPADAEALVRHAESESAGTVGFILCRTREGRVTPALRIGGSQAEANSSSPNVWIQARQHAWESGSSWVATGLVKWLISDDPAATDLRSRAVITVVPIMDIDNVARGAGGKNQIPQDHNRDWTDQPYWRAVIAAQQAIRTADAEGAFDLFIDLHNPGADARNPYFYIPPEELRTRVGQENLDRFLNAAESEMTGPLAFKGRTIASGGDYDPNWQAISKNWVATHTRDGVVAVTLETAWNTPHSTQAGYQQVGRELGRAIALYMQPAATAGSSK